MEVERVKPPQPKKNMWKPEEDLILKNYVEAHGEGNWATVSERSGLMRGGKSCRLRWKNYLRPNIKRGEMSKEEEDLIIRMHKLLGNRWSLIAGRLPGRTDNEVKNYWNTHLNKRCLVGKRKATDSISYHLDEDKEENINKKNKLCQSDQQYNGSCPDLTKLCLDGRKEEEEKDQEESTTSNPWKWKDDSRNSFEYCDMEYPIMGAGGNNNNASFVFDDEPLIAYLDSFVVFEAFGCDGEEAYAQMQMQSVMEY